ncbi:RNA-directed DNA polymerase, eukaryota, reverse transcriptase zinc-binding domain protein, partial [Tanacetum coccineum]
GYEDELVDAIGESDKKFKGRVFGCVDKVNTTCAEPSISMNKIDGAMNSEWLYDNHDKSGDKMSNDAYETVSNEESNKSKANSYAKVAMDNKVINNKLWTIPTEILDNDRELVIFDDELVALGNPEVCLDKVEPDVLPLWIKLHNVLIEAWTDKGLSAITSRLGKPLIMDAMTANLCKYGRGKVGYARILVEVSAKGGFMKKIKLVYKNANDGIKGSNFVKVEYVGKPVLYLDMRMENVYTVMKLKQV